MRPFRFPDTRMRLPHRQRNSRNALHRGSGNPALARVRCLKRTDTLRANRGCGYENDLSGFVRHLDRAIPVRKRAGTETTEVRGVRAVEATVLVADPERNGDLAVLEFRPILVGLFQCSDVADNFIGQSPEPSHRAITADEQREFLFRCWFLFCRRFHFRCRFYQSPRVFSIAIFSNRAASRRSGQRPETGSLGGFCQYLRAGGESYAELESFFLGGRSGAPRGWCRRGLVGHKEERPLR